MLKIALCFIFNTYCQAKRNFSHRKFSKRPKIQIDLSRYMPIFSLHLTSTPEQVAGALAVTGAHIITPPIKVVETVSRTDSNTSKTPVEKSEYPK